MSIRNRRNYYRLLQVQPDAPAEVIRASFRTLMRELRQHPDLGGETSDAALLNEAYATLNNPALRAEYDKAVFARCTRKSVSFNADPRPNPGETCPFCKSPLPRSAQQVASCSVCRSPLQAKRNPGKGAFSQRALARIKRTDPIYYSSRWPQEPRKARMTDLSPKGMRFLTDESLKPGAVLKISGPGFHASAVVTNLCVEELEGEKMYAVGVSFLATEFVKRTGSFLSTTA
jgi:curved DNA-binding protein CbpA